MIQWSVLLNPTLILAQNKFPLTLLYGCYFLEVTHVLFRKLVLQVPSVFWGQGSCDTSGLLVLPSMVTPFHTQLVLQIMLNRDLARHKNRLILEVQACCKICKVYVKGTKITTTIFIYLYSVPNVFSKQLAGTTKNIICVMVSLKLEMKVSLPSCYTRS